MPKIRTKLLNYTTSIESSKTINEIMGILSKNGAKAVLIDYDDDGSVSGLSFKIHSSQGNELGIKLPVNYQAVLKILERQGVVWRLRTKEQALRVAWRILKHWVEAQMAILQVEMVTLEQIFLPYFITPSGKTLYEAMVDSRFQLPQGNKDSEEAEN